MLEDRPPNIRDIRSWIPILPPLSLTDGIITQHDESAFDQADIGALILRRHSGKRIVATRGDDGGKSLARCWKVEITGDPEVGTAREHHVFNAISVFLCRLYNNGIERRLQRKFAEHSEKILSHHLIARLDLRHSLQKSALPVPRRSEPI